MILNISQKLFCIVTALIHLFATLNAQAEDLFDKANPEVTTGPINTQAGALNNEANAEATTTPNINAQEQVLFNESNTKVNTSPDINAQAQALYDEADAEVTARPIPDEILHMFDEKTEFNEHIEDCMNEFARCTATVTKYRPFCGINIVSKDKRFFHSICEMDYENCKLKIVYWQYRDDKLC